MLKKGDVIKRQDPGLPTVVTRDIKPGDEVVSVFGEGPKPIGAVERVVTALSVKGLKEAIADCVQIWKEKDGIVIMGDLADHISKNVYGLMVGKKGSQLNIPSPHATMVMMKDEEGIVVEIRRPNMPYQRGKLMGTELQAALGVPLLIEGTKEIERPTSSEGLS